MLPNKSNEHIPPPPPPPPQRPPSPPHHHYYTPIPSQVQDQNYTVLPSYHPENPSRNCRIILTVSLILLPLLVYIFWPSDPGLKIQRLQLIHLHIHTKPVICVDLSLNATLKVHNVDVYYMDYRTLEVAVGYRGKKLGHVRSENGHVRALGSSSVEAELDLECVKVLSDVVFLLEDLAKGTVPFDTVTEVTGRLGIFFFRFPLKVKAKVSCEVLLNTKNQTILNQDCNPKEIPFYP